jgi:hypothetical protein
MKRSFCDTNNRSVRQEIIRRLCNPDVHCRIDMIPHSSLSWSLCNTDVHCRIDMISTTAYPGVYVTRTFIAVLTWSPTAAYPGVKWIHCTQTTAQFHFPTFLTSTSLPNKWTVSFRSFYSNFVWISSPLVLHVSLISSSLFWSSQYYLAESTT